MKKWISISLLVVFCLTAILTSLFQGIQPPSSDVVQNKAKVISFTSNPQQNEQLITPDPANNSCLTCHDGVEPIRDPASGMMQQIYKTAAKAGFKDNDCIVCHGGNPEGLTKESAHQGSIDWFEESKGPKNFYPDPGSPWINEHTCGTCHQEQVLTQFTSLMFTEAGKIQGTTWGFGGLQGYEHNVANLKVKEVDMHKRLGTTVYKQYMQQLKKAEPQVFPKEMKSLPKAPTLEEVKQNPKLAVYTYLRAECQRCHTGVKGRFAEGDFRGIGCSSCHIPYSNKGYYEGNDLSIDKDKPGHMLVHSIQGTREAKVTVHGHSYSGIPVKTCQACHNRGRRIGVSYEGLMETAYQSPFMGNGSKQTKLHTKNYLHLQPDVHLTKGMLCQDCHTSGDAHSYGDLSGAIQGAVEIECQDCHGTPSKFPWELPIGYGDEIVGDAPATGAPRGLSDSVLGFHKYGTVYPKEDGYLISSRGNPMPHIVKKGELIILHTAGGKDLKLTPLKSQNKADAFTKAGETAMVHVPEHIDKMECYACHASWAPQCYGCHISVDYTKEELKADWVALAGQTDEHGLSKDAQHYGQLSENNVKDIGEYLIAGKVTEQRSYLRWEDPPLAINGDHRVSPAIPGCQTTVSVKGPDGKMLLKNHIFRIPHVEGAKEEGQLAIDMAPLHPHTVQKKARTCESCHTNPKSMGLGIESGELWMRPDSDFVVDLADANGNPIPKQIDTLFNAIPNLSMDWSRIRDEEGNQLQTVGHHLSGSRPLNNNELIMLDRDGVCLSCHKDLPNDPAIDLMHHVNKYAGKPVDRDRHSWIINKNTHVTAWLQAAFMIFGTITMILLIIVAVRKFRKK